MRGATKARETRQERLARLRAFARLLDSAILIPGTRFRIGIDALVGLVPGFGDVVGAVLSGYIIVAAARLGVPAAVVGRMLLNLAVDALVGAVPVLGDLFDFAWKANDRNMALVERAIVRPGRERAVSLALLAGAAGVVVAIVVGLAAIASWVVRQAGEVLR